MGLPLLSAILLILTLPPFRLYWAAGFALAPLLLFLRKQTSLRQSFGAGALAGILYFGYGFYPILYFSIHIYFCALLAHVLFLAFFAAGVYQIQHRFKSDFVFWAAPAVVWKLLGTLYAYSPLGEAAVQALFSQSLVFMQISRPFGVFAAGFLFLLMNAALALLAGGRTQGRIFFVFCSAVFIAGNLFWGYRVLSQPPVPAGKHSIALIQHNLPVSKDWWLQHHRQILARYRELALEAAKNKPEMILFPSYALPFDAYRQPAFFETLAKETGAHLLVSTYVPAVENKSIAEAGQFEMALLYSPEKGLVSADKAVQGPPFRKIHEVLSVKNQVLETPAGKLGVMLCFEDTLFLRARQEVSAGAEVLAAISNPGHFTKTFLPDYHLLQDQWRAVETARPVIRVSAQGPTAFIDRYGRIQKQTEREKSQILYGKL